MVQKIIIAFLLSVSAAAQVLPVANGGTGSSSGFTATGVVNLFSGCSSSYPLLKYDGTCTTASGGSGTVTSVAMGNVSPLFTCSVSNPTTAASISCTLTSTVTAYYVFGNCSGSTGSPSFCALTSNMLPTLTPSAVGLSNVTNDTQTQAAVVPNTAPGSGQLLVGNGSAYAPQTVSGDGTLNSSGALTVSTVKGNVPVSGDTTSLTIQDTFLTGLFTTGNIGQLGWTLNGTSCGSATNAGGSWPYTGALQLATGTTSGNTCQIKFINNLAAIAGGGLTWSSWKIIWILKIPTTSTVGVYVGLNSGATSVPTSDFIGMRYDTTSSDTAFNLCAGSTCDSTTYTLDTNFHKLTIYSTVGGTVWMQWDSNTARSFCSSSCNVTVTPTGAGIGPIAMAVTRTTAARNVQIDYFWLQVTGLSR